MLVLGTGDRPLAGLMRNLTRLADGKGPEPASYSLYSLSNQEEAWWIWETVPVSLSLKCLDWESCGLSPVNPARTPVARHRSFTFFPSQAVIQVSPGSATSKSRSEGASLLPTGSRHPGTGVNAPLAKLLDPASVCSGFFLLGRPQKDIREEAASHRLHCRLTQDVAERTCASVPLSLMMGRPLVTSNEKCVPLSLW